MKHKILTKLGSFILLVGIVTSCTWIDPEINVNPDAPLNVPPDLILPQIQARTAFNVVGGNDQTRTQALWIQHLTGVTRQSQAEGSYIHREGDVNNLWGDVYSDALMDTKQIFQQVGVAGNESFHFLGVTQILQAVILGYATDVWGDIPWSQALLGSENLTPEFDSQESIYATIQSLLDQGIANCSRADGGVLALSGDIIFSNDTEKWVQAAWALKARYALQLAKRNGNAAYNDALLFSTSAFQTNDGNMKYYYAEDNANNANPLYLFNVNRTDVRMCKTLVDSLVNHQDPRLPQFCEPTTSDIEYQGEVIPEGSYWGSPIDEAFEAASMPGPGIASNGTPTPIITAAEVHFIRAEAQVMLGQFAAARTSYKEALKVSLEEYGVFNQTWFDAYSSAIDLIPDNEDIMMNAVMTEKWISLCYNSIAYNDWRRTGYPVLVPNPLGSGPSGQPEIPRRYSYPTDANLYNPNTPPLGNNPLWERVWWDAE
jgi:hypothetical protein